jgi:Transposase DDE domain
MVLPPVPAVPAKTPKPRRIGAKPGSRHRTRRSSSLKFPTQRKLLASILPPELAALLKNVEVAKVPPEILAAMVMPSVPLANAVLTAFAYLMQPKMLDDLFDRHRGRSYEDILSFSTFVTLIRDALIVHNGSARQSFQHALEQGTLPTCQEAVYGKLRRIPLSLSLAFMEEVTKLIRDLLPKDVRMGPLPESLDAMTIVILDGKQIKDVAKRLKPVRGKPGKVVGGKILAFYLPSEHLVVSMAADPDGEANDIRLMPNAISRARARIAGIRLWVADRQFCDLTQPVRLTEEGDHFLLRRSMKMGFHPDADRPACTSVDSQGRMTMDQWGWIGSPNEKRRRYVRQIQLVRAGEEAIFLVTDLLDDAAYPAEDLLEVYLHRWEIERVFQQITEVFSLERLVGSTPQATVFQASFCMVLYNLMQMLRAFVSIGREARAAVETVEAVSVELLFRDVHSHLTTLIVLFPAASLVRWFAAESSNEETRERLRSLMEDVWRPRYTKAINKKTRPKVKKAKCSGAHTSVYKVLEEEKKKRLAARKHP